MRSLLGCLLGVLPLLAVPQAGASAADPALRLGMYGVPAASCSLLAASGFTIVQNYQFESSWPEPPDSFVTAARRYMDTAHRHGLRVLLGAPRNWLEKRAEATLRQAIESLRAHPALLAWYEDERAQEGDLEAVRFLARVVDAVDPAHGLIIEEGRDLQALRRIGRARMFTYYPVTQKARAKGRLSTVRQRFPVQELSRPFWPVLQAFGRDLIRDCPQQDLKAPSRDELVFTLYSALQSGAQGVFFYTFLHSTRYDAARKAAGDWPYVEARPLPQVSPGLWQAALSVSRQASLLLPLVNGAPRSTAVTLSKPADGVEMGAWSTPRGMLVLVANARYRPATVVLRCPMARGSYQRPQGDDFAAPQAYDGGTIQLTLPGPGGACVLLER